MSETANTLLVGRAIISYENRVLLLQRSPNDSRNPGLWEFPGGKIDTDEEIEAGLVREVYEETGLYVELTSSVAHVENEVIRTGKYEGRLYVALFYSAQRLGGLVALSSEHHAAEWEDYKSIGTYDLTPESRRAVSSLEKLRGT